MGAIDKLKAFMHARGFDVDPQFNAGYIRFDRAGQGTGWFHGVMSQTESGLEVFTAEFGDWKTQEKHTFNPLEEVTDLTPDQLNELWVAQEEAKKKHQEERDAEYKRVAQACADEWSAMHPDGTDSGYLRKKGIDPSELPGGTFMIVNSVVHVACLDVATGAVVGIQKIYPNGEKLFARGQRKRGTAFYIADGDPSTWQRAYLVEGFATAASVHLATDCPVFGAFDAGNMATVAEALRAKYPSLKIDVAGDDDQFTVVNGKPRNAGRINGDEAARILGGRAVYPKFKALDSRPTDWNDLHQLEGLGAVKGQFQDALATSVYQADPLAPRKTKTGMLLPPGQKDVVDHLLKHFDGKLIKQDRDLFMYTGTHWRHLSMMDQDRLRMLISDVCSGLADVRHLDATFKMLVYALPSPPDGVDLFVPNPTAANFLNGTLHLTREGTKFVTAFRAHSALDYVVNVLPYEYKPIDQLAPNPEFEAMLDRVLEGDPDAAEKRLAIGEMFGACLMPAFPHLWMLHGKAGTGKSTVLKLAARLVSRDNLCHVAPSEFRGFNMESMAAKLVNLDTDIPFDEPIRDEIVKKIIDRESFRIRRKGVKDLNAPIPAVHLFGGNEVPRTLDGASKAHDRRWTFIEFAKFVPKTGHIQDFAEHVFRLGSDGVLRFALLGLARLCESGGHFTVPESSRAKMQAWQLASDPIGQFLDEIRDGEVRDGNTQVVVDDGARWERKQAWTTFVAWFEDTFRFAPRMGKIQFFSRLEGSGFEVKTIKGVRYFAGLGSRPEEGAEY